MRAAVLVAVSGLLVSACSGGSGASGDGREAASSSPAPQGLELVVLGDSMASPSSCAGCTTFPERVAAALGRALGGQTVDVVDLAWDIRNPNPAQIADIVDYVRTDAGAREALAGAEAVLVLVAQNDLAYNRIDDPCGVAPRYPRVRWSGLTHQCMDAALREYAHDLEALLDEIDALRDGRPTMLRVVTAFNTAIGDLVDPTWDSPSAVEPSTYDVSRMVDVQCRLAARHGGRCADVFHVLNGSDGSRSAQRFLNPADATHPYPRGHDAFARTVIALGFRPLVSGRQGVGAG